MSNKTPAEPAAATESARSKSYRLYLLIGIIFIFGCGLLYLTTVGRVVGNRKRITLPDGKKLIVEIADTPVLQAQGLSGRGWIQDDQGMLFVFDAPSKQHCFWMKDMNFSIDMIWLDEWGRIVSIKESVDPATYPESFCPNEPAKYVLEVGSGNAKKYGMYEGTTLHLTD